MTSVRRETSKRLAMGTRIVCVSILRVKLVFACRANCMRLFPLNLHATFQHTQPAFARTIHELNTQTRCELPLWPTYSTRSASRLATFCAARRSKAFRGETHARRTTCDSSRLFNQLCTLPLVDGSLVCFSSGSGHFAVECSCLVGRIAVG